MALDLDAARSRDSFWVPEAPDFSAFYALPAPRGDGMFHPVEHGTYSIDEALKFATREECASWCATQALRWAPVEHAYCPPVAPP